MHNRISKNDIIAHGIISTLSPFFASAMADYFSRAINLSEFNPRFREDDKFESEYCNTIKEVADRLNNIRKRYRDEPKKLFSEKAIEISDLLYKSGWREYENSDNPVSPFLQALTNSWTRVVDYFTKYHIFINPYERDPNNIGEFLVSFGERYNRANRLKEDIEKIIESHGIDHKNMPVLVMQQSFNFLSNKIRENLTGLAELMETKSRTDFFPITPNYNIRVGESELRIDYILGIANAYCPDMAGRLMKGYVRIYPSEKERFKHFI